MAKIKVDKPKPVKKPARPPKPPIITPLDDEDPGGNHPPGGPRPPTKP